jgi:hypothetical protein
MVTRRTSQNVPRGNRTSANVPRSYSMTKTEIESIRDALEILNRLLGDDGLRAGSPTRQRSPVLLFANRYLVRDPGNDMSTEELWSFYLEVVAAGELEPLTRRVFERVLPETMASAFGVKKCHSIRRGARTVRGFRSVGVRQEGGPVTTLET